MDRLIETIRKKGRCPLLYGMTPPKADNPAERLRSISDTRIQRIRQVDVDALVIYDIQPEPSRGGVHRPFPFLETVDPIVYRQEYLAELDLPTVIYQCVGKYTPSELIQNAGKLGEDSMIFVGAASRDQEVKTSMQQAFDLSQAPNWPFLGGIVIPERHLSKSDEHTRMLRKQRSGVQYFISQFVFDTDNLKSLLSDYFYLAQDEAMEMAPVILTLTPCGSNKTIDLLKFLGVHFPHWVENELVHSANPIETSLEMAMKSVIGITDFCRSKGIPFGFNVESVSIKRDEVLASFELVRQIGAFLKAEGLRT